MSHFAARHFAGALLSIAKYGLMFTGLIALLAWEAQTLSHAAVGLKVTRVGANPVLEGLLPVRMGSESDPRLLAVESDAKRLQGDAEQSRVASYVARKYLVAVDAIRGIVHATYATARVTGVDAHLILAVMAIESRFNPFAESAMGAQGLMQVIPKYHLDKFEEHGGRKAALDPLANIQVGALILKDYVRRFGSLEAGLRAYSGATGDDSGYASKVLGERDRLKAVASGKPIPAGVANAVTVNTQVIAPAAAPASVPVPMHILEPVRSELKPAHPTIDEV